jgi:hypothetical protein
MPASRFARWLHARTYPKSGVTGVTGCDGHSKASISAGSELPAGVTPRPKERVTGVTDSPATAGEEDRDTTERLPRPDCPYVRHAPIWRPRNGK